MAKILEEKLFIQSFKLIFKNKISLLIILFDLLFIFSVWAAVKLVNSFIPTDPGAMLGIIQTAPFMILLFFFLVVLYYFILIFIYSFFKYCIMHFIKSYFKKEEFSFKYLWKFYSLNLIIILGYLILFTLGIFIIQYTVANDFVKTFVKILLAIILFLLYTSINVSQSFFINNFKIRTSLKSAIKYIFTKPDYFLVYFISIILIFIYYLILQIIGRFINVAVPSPSLQSFALIYNNAFMIITSIFFYLILYYNRIYFYNLVNKLK